MTFSPHVAKLIFTQFTPHVVKIEIFTTKFSPHVEFTPHVVKIVTVM